MKRKPDLANILNAKLSDNGHFNEIAIDLFFYQYEHNEVYRKYADLVNTDPLAIKHFSQIPFMPVEFFKNNKVVCGDFEPDAIFTSSRTSGMSYSSHYVRSEEDYFKTTDFCFREFFGDLRDYCHLALLPSYLEREGSSLISMMDFFIKNSKYSQSGFYLDEFDELKNVIKQNEEKEIPTILWGVTFALLDFAELVNFKLKHTQIIETGGMKGRRKEITRSELYEILTKSFGVEKISSEYGMTEMLSQCYSKELGRFYCPPNVRILGRELNDPFSISEFGRNKAVNVIDLANIDSCAFLALSDLCNINEDGSFEVLGRVDLSDIRGCNLMVK